MALSAQEIIIRAFRRIKVEGVFDTPDTEELDDALSVLNSMMSGWQHRGLSYEHVDLALGTDQALGAGYDEALEFLLAEKLANQYNTSMSREDYDEAKRWWNNISAAFGAHDTEATFDKAITRLPSQFNRFGLVYSGES